MRRVDWTYELPPVTGDSVWLEEYLVYDRDGAPVGRVFAVLEHEGRRWLGVEREPLPTRHDRRAVPSEAIEETDHENMAVHLALEPDKIEDALQLDAGKGVEQGGEAQRVTSIPRAELPRRQDPGAVGPVDRGLVVGAAVASPRSSASVPGRGPGPTAGSVLSVPETSRRLSFGAHSTAYERARPEWPEEAARWLVPADAAFVVEVGAGTGKLTRAVAALGVRVLAVEPDARMLSVLREHGLEGAEGSAETIPVGDGEADGVVAGSSLHWFELDEALAEFRRVLRPGGRFGFGWNHRDVRHPTIAAMSEVIYSSRPSRQTWGWQRRDWQQAVTERGLFRDVEQALFVHVHEFPREALEDHLLSYSGLAALPEDERRREFAAVAEILDGDPSLHEGDRLRLPFVVDAYRAARA
jgi:SAM-dependent methyltransferase